MTENDDKSSKKTKRPDTTVHGYYKTDAFQEGFRRWQKDKLDEYFDEKVEEPEKEKKKDDKEEGWD